MSTLLTVFAFLLAAASPSAAPTAAPAATVHMSNFAFAPASVTVHTGDTVKFVNDDPATHDVTGDGLKSGPIDQGGTWTYTFTKPGTYTYICSYHPSMKGTIIVAKPE